MADSFRNSAELSFGSGEEFTPDQILKGLNPVIAKSFEEGMRDSFAAGIPNENASQP